MDSAGELESTGAQLMQTVNECTGTQTYTHTDTQCTYREAGEQLHG